MRIGCDAPYGVGLLWLKRLDDKWRHTRGRFRAVLLAGRLSWLRPIDAAGPVEAGRIPQANLRPE